MNKVITKWKGLPGHFICANRCCFSLHTTVENFDTTIRVSTVGCYHIVTDVKERTINNREEVGCDRLYETMTFFEDAHGSQAEEAEWFEPYNDEESAEAGHLRIVGLVEGYLK